VVVADVVPGDAATQAEAAAQGLRPYLRMEPCTAVEDLGEGPTGLRWVKLAETMDTRQPLGGEGDIEERHVLYRLDERGHTLVTRYDAEGRQVPVPGTQGQAEGADYEVDMGRLVDAQGQAQLPVLVARYGQHPQVGWLGTGLLMGLDDIVLDLYNQLTEVREGYRDAAFGMMVHVGPDPENILAQMTKGTRLVHLGDDPNSSMERVAAEAGEVQAGINLLDMGIRSWALSAKRKADEATERAGARSGISLQAEFQLDLRPLLVRVSEMLDGVESNAMQLLGQLGDATAQVAALADVGVERDTEYQLEDEAARISRIVGEWLQAVGLPLVPSQYVPIAMRWSENNDAMDMDEMVATADGAEVARRDLVQMELQAQAEAADRAQRQAAEFPLL
jgi:hypothetical protein